MTGLPGTHEATAEERDAARHLLAKIKYMKDAEDEREFSQLWARDARLAIVSNGAEPLVIDGRAAIMAFYLRSWATGGHGLGGDRETHIFENPYIVALDDSRLLAVHTAVFAAMGGDLPRLIGFGTFRDELIFEDGMWRLADRRSNLRRRPRKPA